MSCSVADVASLANRIAIFNHPTFHTQIVFTSMHKNVALGEKNVLQWIEFFFIQLQILS